MKTPTATPNNVFEIRKYPNRRFYNATHSRHLTLEEIHNLVKAGHQVRVIDNQTSADITAKVLAQIILDLDTPKLDLFPAPLLAEMIRVNDQLLLSFYEKFFHQALRTFLNFQRAMEAQLKDRDVLPAMFPPIPAWTQAMATPFGLGQPAPDETRTGTPPPEPLSTTLAELQRQLTELQTQLAHSQKLKARPPRAKRPK